MRPHEFWALYRAVYRRRWLLAAVVSGTLFVVGLGCLFLPRYYRASASVMPSEAALNQSVLSGPGTDGGGQARSGDPRKQEEQLATLLGLAKSGSVRQRAIGACELATTPAELEELVQVELPAGTLIRFSVLSPTPEGAVRLANAMADGFVAYYRKLTGDQAKANTALLDDALGAAKAKLSAIEVQLKALKTKEGEAALPIGTAENPFLKQFYALRQEVDAIRSQLSEVEGRLAGVKAELAKQAPLREIEVKTSDNPVVKALQAQQAQLERDLLVAKARYTDKNRRVIDLRTQLEDVKQRIARESGQMVAQRTVTANPVHDRLRDQMVDLQSERKALTAKLQALSQAMKENERRAGELADSSVVLGSMQAEWDTAQAQVQQLKQMRAASYLAQRESLDRGELRAVNPASSAVGPVVKSGPTVWQLLLLGVVLSAGLGLGCVIGLAFLDTRVRGRADLFRELQLPVPAIIPALEDGSTQAQLARITELQPLSPHAEAYRFLRAQLVNRNGGAPLRTLMLATARPGQGGSTTAVNLALSLAEIGERVVLVDADLRRPSLHAFFGQENDAGLTTVLSNGGDTSHTLRQTTSPNLVLLPAGPPCANPASLLSSGRMRRLLEQLRLHSDYVVIDTPSAGAFADAVMLAPLVDGVILVTRANQSLRETEHHTKELLKTVGATVVGVVLNDSPADEVDSYRFHESYYRHAQALLPPPNTSEDRRTEADVSDDAMRIGGEGVGTAPSVPTDRPGSTEFGTSERDGSTATGRRSGRHQQFAVAAVAILALLLIAFTAATLSHRGRRPRPTPGVARPAPASVGAKGKVTVRARILSPTRVRVQVDGKLVMDQMLSMGPITWPSGGEVRVWVDDPTALQIGADSGGESIPLQPFGKKGDIAPERWFTAESVASAVDDAKAPRH